MERQYALHSRCVHRCVHAARPQQGATSEGYIVLQRLSDEATTRAKFAPPKRQLRCFCLVLKQPHDNCHDIMPRSLATSSVECAQLLDQLSSLLHDSRCEERSALQQTAAEDQSARFRIWAGNLGAFQRLPAASSLDYRLLESPKIAAQVQELLKDLYDAAENGAVPPPRRSAATHRSNMCSAGHRHGGTTQSPFRTGR